MLKKSTTEGINIRIWVLYFTDFAQNARDSIKTLFSQIADVIVFDMFVCESLQMEESRVGVSEDSMPIARNNSTFFQCLVYEFFNQATIRSFSLMEVLQFSQPFKALLVGKTVEGTSKTIHSSRV